MHIKECGHGLSLCLEEGRAEGALIIPSGQGQFCEAVLEGESCFSKVIATAHAQQLVFLLLRGAWHTHCLPNMPSGAAYLGSKDLFASSILMKNAKNSVRGQFVSPLWCMHANG